MVENDKFEKEITRRNHEYTGGKKLFKNKTGQVRSGWMIALAFLTMFIFQGIFMFPGIILLGTVEITGSSISLDVMNDFDKHPWITLIAQGGGTIGGIIAILLLWRFLNKKPLKDIGFRGSIKDLWFGLSIGTKKYVISCNLFRLYFV